VSGRIEAASAPLATLPAAPLPPTRTGVAAPRGADPAARAAHKAKELEVASREFEQIFVRSMLKTTPIAGKGDIYGDLAVDAMAKSVTAGKGLGLGDLIRRSIETTEAAARSSGLGPNAPTAIPLPSTQKDEVPLKASK
jgi:Rod binding domain-containing protein